MRRSSRSLAWLERRSYSKSLKSMITQRTSGNRHQSGNSRFFLFGTTPALEGISLDKLQDIFKFRISLTKTQSEPAESSEAIAEYSGTYGEGDRR